MPGWALGSSFCGLSDPYFRAAHGHFGPSRGHLQQHDGEENSGRRDYGRRGVSMSFVSFLGFPSSSPHLFRGEEDSEDQEYAEDAEVEDDDTSDPSPQGSGHGAGGRQGHGRRGRRGVGRGGRGGSGPKQRREVEEQAGKVIKEAREKASEIKKVEKMRMELKDFDHAKYEELLKVVDTWSNEKSVWRPNREALTSVLGNLA